MSLHPNPKLRRGLSLSEVVFLDLMIHIIEDTDRFEDNYFACTSGAGFFFLWYKYVLTKEELKYWCDIGRIAITKKDPGVFAQLHPFTEGVALDERRALEEAYFLLAGADELADEDLQDSEAFLNRAFGMMRVFGVMPEHDEEGKAMLALLEMKIKGIKPS